MTGERGKNRADDSRRRLAAELRANLAKRKDQARARAAAQAEAPRHRDPDKSEESDG